MKKTAFLAVVVCVATASTVFSQSRFAQVVEIQVAPLHQEAFEEYGRKIKEAADETASPVTWATFYAAVGKPGGTYRISLGFDSWAERDQWSEIPQMLTEAFGDQEAAQILRSGRAGIQSVTTRIWERLDDGSSNPRTGGEPANFYQVSIRHINPEMVPEYRALQRRWKMAYEAASGGPTVARWILRYGDGAGTTFRRTQPFDTWAELDQWIGRAQELMEEHLGTEERLLVGSTRRRIEERNEVFVSAYRPDLSRTVASPTSD